MAVLDTKQRKDLSKSVFGLPAERKYPMPDREHAIDAKARALQELKKRKLSRADFKTVIAKANRVIKEDK